MHTWLLLIAPLLHVATALEHTHGVAPALLARYAPSKSATWQCLDGSKEIAWAAVNDDYCDCKDGSDEPGTGACPNTTFYCKNEGHIGASIPATRVNDGICERECCDGSDEPSGKCPNICKQVGIDYRTKHDAEMKTRKTGSKIRSTYLAFAQKEKKRLEDEVVRSDAGIAVREKEVARLRDVLERTESISAAALEEKKKSPLYGSLLEHHAALKSLQRVHAAHLAREKELGEILDALRTTYNPNYQDMAVLAAVRQWEALAGLPHINDVGKDGEGDAAEESADGEGSEEEEEVVEEGMWTETRLEHELDGLIGQDHVSLLLEHDRSATPAEADSTLFDVSAYLPEALSSWLGMPGGAKHAADASAATETARKALQDAEHSLKLAQGERKKAADDLADLFDPEGFGAQGEWKKLDGTCLEQDAGEYTYEVCLFDEARQKPNHGGQTFSLGKFASWNPAPGVEPGSREFYTRQVYDKGTRCWNGPQRSVKLTLTCGTENVLLTVAEAEKCEYEVTGTTPALCLPLDADESARDEL